MPNKNPKNRAIKVSGIFLLQIIAFSLGVSEAAAVKPFAAGPQLFHKGGTGNCDGCHGSRGAQGAQDNPVGGFGTLLGSDPSSTCLRCHEAPQAGFQKQEYYVSTRGAELGAGAPPRQFTPGGDFGWLKKSYTWSGEGGALLETSPGERHGHNIVAADFNYGADSKIQRAPGGSYPSRSLSCISCHDPHGNYRRSADGSIAATGRDSAGSGSFRDSRQPDAEQSVGSYRMLAGQGYQTKDAGGHGFSAPPPAAVAPASYNREEGSTETRVAYGSGMSEWCGNCHTGIHNDFNSQASLHPSGNHAKLSSEVVSNYNSYLASGNLNGSASNAYSSLVPFEMGTDDYSVLRSTANSDGSDRRGANRNANVMCLSCHRAHASGFDSMTRWNVSATFIVHNGKYPGTDNAAPAALAQGRTSAEVEAALYGRPSAAFASYQRSLCNKCHAKD